MTAPAFKVFFMDRASRIGGGMFALLVVALVLAPYWADRQNLRLLAEIYAYVALASAWNLLAGYAGLVSIGQQAYVGLGGYLLFALTMLAGVPPLWSIPLVGLIAAAVSIRSRRWCSACAGTISPSAPGWWPRCSGSWRPKFPCSAAAPAPACRPAS